MKNKGSSASVTVKAPPHIVRHFACDHALLAEWNNEYTGCHPVPERCTATTIAFSGTTATGGRADWELTLSVPDRQGEITVAAKVTEDISLRNPVRWWRAFGQRRRDAQLDRNLQRLKGFAESAAHHAHNELKPGDMIALLSVYTAQFGSFTTLLWQVPALGLTAQAFLMTIILSSSFSNGARYAAAGLSIIIALAAIYLMHDQRARAINHAELAKRISYRLSLTNKVLGGTFGLDDAVPKRGTDSQNVWTTNHVIYLGWQICMFLFAATGFFVILSVSFPALNSWFTAPPS
jgi:hypothetical protein